MGRDSDGRETDERVSRRTFTKALGAGAGALALGAGATGSAAARQEKSGLWETLPVSGGDFKLQVNPWGSQDTGSDWDQTIWTESDGTYGYEFGPEGSSTKPNFPQGLIGAKPWRPTTDVAEFPQRRKNIDEFEATFDTTQDIDGEDYNFMCEWWLSESPPPNGGDVDYEIMLVMDWGEDFGHGMYEESVYTDQFGNTVDWWEKNLAGGTNAEFHQFALSSGTTSATVDLRRLMDFLNERLDVNGDLYVSGLEYGNEIYRGVSGETTFEQVDVTVDGTTYTSGPDGGSGGGGGSDDGDSDDGSADVEPGVYRVRNVNSGLVAEVVGGSTSDGANVQQWPYSDYEHKRWDIQPADGENVYTLTAQHSGKRLTIDDGWAVQESADGSDAQRFRIRDADAEGYHLENLADDNVLSVEYFEEERGYDITSFKRVGVAAQRWELVPESDDGGSDPVGDGLVVNDFDSWSDGENDLGNWTGAGGFENGGGEVVDGDLKLDYNNAGWMATVVNQDISDYSQLVLTVKGATGGETDDLTLDWENSRTNLADLTTDSIGTSFGDVAVDLADIGVDESSPGQLNLDFWEGADSVVYIDEIRLV